MDVAPPELSPHGIAYLGLKPEATLRGCSAANRRLGEGTSQPGPVPSVIRCGAAADGSLWLQPQVCNSQSVPSCGAAIWPIDDI